MKRRLHDNSDQEPSRSNIQRTITNIFNKCSCKSVEFTGVQLVYPSCNRKFRPQGLVNTRTCMNTLDVFCIEGKRQVHFTYKGRNHFNFYKLSTGKHRLPVAGRKRDSKPVKDAMRNLLAQI